MQDTFFKGLRVVELAAVLAGPAVGMFFAELGAEVIKIENKATGGDMTRGWKNSKEDPDAPISAYFCSINWGKKHIFLDLNDPQDRAAAEQYIAGADIVISNFKPSSARRMELDAATLLERYSRLIFAQIDAFADPEDERPAFDMVLQAEAGFLYMCGEPDRPPVRMPVAFIDLMAAHQIKEGLLLALLHRYQTGMGSVVRVSLMEAALGSLANQAANYLNTGIIPQRMGTAHPNIAPYGDIFTSADGQSVLVAAGTERHFRQLCATLDVAEYAQDPAFTTNAARVVNRQHLLTLLEPAFQKLPIDTILQRCHKAGVPVGRIRNMQEVFDLPEAQAMILKEKTAEGIDTQRIQSVAFSLRLLS
jgi:crotonobetainyl-CoA:carnitine CoA-transferase CaiB-like acyl-CoA transferase